MTLLRPHFILYVRDQARAAAFYREVLSQEPRLDVPGMTEFALPGGSVLGLMPESGIDRLLGHAIDGLRRPSRVPRAELYLIADRAQEYGNRALEAGARELSPWQDRDWGDTAAYYEDPDGHVLAFAERTVTS